MDDREHVASLRRIYQDRTRVPNPVVLHQRVMAIPSAGHGSGTGWLDGLVYSIRSTFSATSLAGVGAIVALVAGLLLVVQISPPAAVPAAAPGDPGTFSPTGSMALPRTGHSATLLADGRVLVVGGGPVTGGHAKDNVHAAAAEVWDPATSEFSPAGSLAEPRDAHTATLLPDGRVLVVGGVDEDYRFRASAEVWDPNTGTFSPAGSLAKTHASYGQNFAVLQPDGRVVVLYGEPYAAEVWDPATGSFSPATGGHPDIRSLSAPVLTALSDGRVLFVDERGKAVVWDPSTETTSSAGSPALRWPSSATLLPDGRVLVIGEAYPSSAEVISAEVWDPATSMFSPAGALGEPRVWYGVSALPDGRVLVVGGCWSPGDYYCDDKVDSAEVWDPDANTFRPTGSPAEAHDRGTATALRDGRVLMVGGEDADGSLASAEIWSPNGGQPPAD